MSEGEEQAKRGERRGRTWIFPDIFDANLKPKDWKDDPELRAGVDWLLSCVPADEWKLRRFAALRRFNDAVSGKSADPSGKGRFFDDRDRCAWYFFLGQAVLDQPIIYDYMYGSRVIPILTTSGRNLELLKGVKGIEARVRRMVEPEKIRASALSRRAPSTDCNRRTADFHWPNAASRPADAQVWMPGDGSLQSQTLADVLGNRSCTLHLGRYPR